MKRTQLWNLVKILVLVMIILTFTPLLTPVGKHQPELAGMPYTLWANILSAFILVGLTWIGTRVHPGSEN